MGLFSPKVPDTISDKKWASIQRRAEKYGTPMPFSKKGVAQQKASERQRGKSRWS